MLVKFTDVHQKYFLETCIFEELSVEIVSRIQDYLNHLKITEITGQMLEKYPKHTLRKLFFLLVVAYLVFQFIIMGRFFFVSCKYQNNNMFYYDDKVYQYYVIEYFLVELKILSNNILLSISDLTICSAEKFYYDCMF